MVTLQAVGVTTFSYSADTALEVVTTPEDDGAEAEEDLVNEEEPVRFKLTVLPLILFWIMVSHYYSSMIVRQPEEVTFGITSQK